MNKTLKYALGAVLSLGVIVNAIAQENFPDVPENHWAFEALARMKKDGLLMGYPDGLFRGGRPATRYEMAVAIHATYVYLRNLIDDHEVRIKKLEGMGPGTDDSWKAAVDALKNDIAGMKGWGDSIADLKRMAATFEKELAAQGVDIEAMKKDLAALSARVDKLEKNKLPITISGTVNLFASAGGSTSGRAGVGVDGSFFGSRDILPTPGGNITWAPVGLSQDFSVFHEALIKLAGTNEEGPKWWASILIGNLLSSNAMVAGGGNNYSDNYGTDIAFRNLVVEFDTAILGQGFNAKIGRVGYKISPFIYQMPDPTAYYDGFFDDGNWTMDGGVFGFNFGAAKFNVFAGRNSNRNSALGNQLGGGAVGAVGPDFAGGARPIGLNAGHMGVDQTLGLHLNVPLTEKGGLDLAYLFHEANQRTGAGVNRAQVYGGELNWDFGAFDFNAGYAKSNIYNGKASIAGHNNKNNDTWHVGAAMENDKFGLNAGYAEIQPNFKSMGDWGRVGMWWNPNDVKGFTVGGHLNLTEALTLKAKGGFWTGIGNTAGSLRTNDKINNYTADLNYQMSNGWDLNLGAEFVDWNIAGVAGKPRERWYNIGLGYKLSDAAKLSILWQISDYDGKGVAGFNPIAAGGYANTRASGNLITTQFSVKF